MAKTVYTVQGSSTIKPVGLPEGFEVETNTAVFDREVSGFTLSDSAYQENSLFVQQDAMALRHLNRDEVTALRDALSEWLSESVSVLRVVHDANDSVSSEWRWYEIDTDKFIYHVSVDRARRDAKRYRQGTFAKDLTTFDRIKSDYGVRSVVSWEV